MNLVIDIGNTRTKYSVFDNDAILITDSVNEFTALHIEKLQHDFTNLKKVIICSVKNYPADLKEALKENFDVFLALETNTPLPIENCYQSEKTLGKDRIAAVIGAFELFPRTNILVIDAGTAITYDILTADGKYLGGNIAPGLEMRFKALNYYTGKLPKIEIDESNQLFGRTTEEAIRAGVQNGFVYEVDQTITAFKEIYPDLTVIITGGNADFFGKKLNNAYCVRDNLISYGLNCILEHNV